MKNRLWLVFACSAAWTLGFALCWASKWLISSIVLKENIVLDALKAILMRTSDGTPSGRWDTIRMNFDMFFLSNGLRGAWPLMLPILLLFICAALFRKKDALKNVVFLPVLVYPYIWYLMLNNHSSVHFWFTYRLQAITWLGAFLIAAETIDFKRIRNVYLRLSLKSKAAS